MRSLAYALTAAAVLFAAPLFALNGRQIMEKSDSLSTRHFRASSCSSRREGVSRKRN